MKWLFSIIGALGVSLGIYAVYRKIVKTPEKPSVEVMDDVEFEDVV